MVKTVSDREKGVEYSARSATGVGKRGVFRTVKIQSVTGVKCGTTFRAVKTQWREKMA